MPLPRRTRAIAVAALSLIALSALAPLGVAPLNVAWGQSPPPAPPTGPARPGAPARPDAPGTQPGRGRPGEGGEGRGRGPGGDRPQASVGGSMKGMNRALRQLRRQLDESAPREELLRSVDDLQRNCVAAKGAPLPQDVLEHAKSDADKAALAGQYRTHLMNVLRKLVELEQSVVDGKPDGAKAIAAELVKLRDAGHKAMGVEDDEGDAPTGN